MVTRLDVYVRHGLCLLSKIRIIMRVATIMLHRSFILVGTLDTATHFLDFLLFGPQEQQHRQRSQDPLF